jgi:hypothetical protein
MDALTQRQWNEAKIDVMGFVLFLGQQFLDLEKRYPFIPKEILIEATWLKWRTLSHDRQGAFTRVALFPVAIVESADMLGAHYRARAIFKDSHPMAMYLPDKLQELSIADPMPRAVAAMGIRFT